MHKSYGLFSCQRCDVTKYYRTQAEVSSLLDAMCRTAPLACDADGVLSLAWCISGSALPSLHGIYNRRCKVRAVEIIKDLINSLSCLMQVW